MLPKPKLIEARGKHELYHVTHGDQTLPDGEAAKKRGFWVVSQNSRHYLGYSRNKALGVWAKDYT